MKPTTNRRIANLTVGLLSVAALFGLWIAAKNAPEVRRYLRIRSM